MDMSSLNDVDNLDHMSDLKIFIQGYICPERSTSCIRRVDRTHRINQESMCPGISRWCTRRWYRTDHFNQGSTACAPKYLGRVDHILRSKYFISNLSDLSHV